MATATDGFNALIAEAERAAGLAALLPDLRRLKTMHAVLDEAKAKAAREERRATDLAADNEKAAGDLQAAQRKSTDAKAAIAAAAAAHAADMTRNIAAAQTQAEGIVTAARTEATGILKDATARAAGLVADAEASVLAKQREVDALNAAIAKLNQDHAAQAGKLAEVARQREALRRSL